MVKKLSETYIFEIQKCREILYAHKLCFLMPGHISKTWFLVIFVIGKTFVVVETYNE